MPDPTELGFLLRSARIAVGYATLYAAQKATGIRASQIAEWEAGQHSPSVASLEKLATAYGLDVAIAFQPRGPG